MCKKAEVDMNKRAGELTEDEVCDLSILIIHCYTLFSQIERVVTILQNPRPYKIPDFFLNRQKDIKDGKYSQVIEEHS